MTISHRDRDSKCVQVVYSVTVIDTLLMGGRDSEEDDEEEIH